MSRMAIAAAAALLGACGGAPAVGPGVFVTLPPGSPLPGDSECAARVLRSSWEPRPDNVPANQTQPTVSQLTTFLADSWGGVDVRANSVLRQRVTGAFSGTTDEIIQWGACKWGLDVDVVRAQAAVESWWHQDTTGDLTIDSTLWPPGAACTSGTPLQCYQSYGLLQIKWVYWKSAWPISRDSTAFNVDAALAWRRTCYEGYIQWLSTAGTPGYPSYGPGDLWGCVGQWFSGAWYDVGAVSYIGSVQTDLANRVWLGPYF